MMIGVRLFLLLLSRRFLSFRLKILIYFDLKNKFYFYVLIYKKVSFFVPSTYLVKILHKPSYSILSITLSCIDFLYNLSKDSIAS